MKLDGIQRLGRAFRRLKHRLFPGVRILRYHRVIDLASDPHALCVTPRHFAQHLEVLTRYGRVIPLTRLVGSLRNGNPPHGVVVLTFDDGYADNLYHAKPLLERYYIPATIFVTTGYLEDQREFWSDELERVLLLPGTLPKMLQLTVNGSPFQCALDDATTYHERDYGRNASWNVRADHDPSSRHRLFRLLHDVLKPVPHLERRRVLDALLTWSGLPSGVRSTHRPLTPDELTRLAEGPLIEIGAHSVTHPVLSLLSAASQREEILQSKAYLETRLGSPVTSFAYPYGSPCDYSAETVAILQDAGFECAASTVSDRVARDADRFQLPRLYVGNWDGEEFARRLGLHV
jgi:peptidoglycan/xylan/chitin deacetylase (PgdA/CDA1 family)